MDEEVKSVQIFPFPGSFRAVVWAEDYKRLERECLLWKERAEAAHPMLVVDHGPTGILRATPTPSTVPAHPVQISISAASRLYVLMSNGKIFKSDSPPYQSSNWEEIKGPWNS